MYHIFIKNNEYIKKKKIKIWNFNIICHYNIRNIIFTVNYNLIFNDGERVILNAVEKSKTTFNKFIYSIENEEMELLMMDKEHFNTLELLINEEKEFYFHGHNRIYQYILTFMIIILSLKIFCNIKIFNLIK